MGPVDGDVPVVYVVYDVRVIVQHCPVGLMDVEDPEGRVVTVAVTGTLDVRVGHVCVKSVVVPSQGGGKIRHWE